MAYTPILIGAAPDDNTGDPLRSACQKINEMLQELYKGFGAAATTAALNAEILQRGLLITEINAALLGKANSADVANLAGFASVIRRDIPQEVAPSEREIHATNAGVFETFVFELFGKEEDIAPGNWPLPILPKNFLIYDAHLVMAYGDGTYALTATVSNGDDDMISFSATETSFSAGPGLYQPTTYINKNWPALKGGQIILTSLTPAAYASETMRGLSLWIRGTWKA